MAAELAADDRHRRALVAAFDRWTRHLADGLAAMRSPRELGVRRVAWLASASAAVLRCRGAERARSQATLRVVAAELRSALPEGSAVGREVASLAAGCR